MAGSTLKLCFIIKQLIAGTMSKKYTVLTALEEAKMSIIGCADGTKQTSGFGFN